MITLQRSKLPDGSTIVVITIESHSFTTGGMSEERAKRVAAHVEKYLRYDHTSEDVESDD